MTEPGNSTLPAPARRPWWKRLLRIFFWLGGIFTFLLLLLVGLTFIYQDEVKGFVISEINKRVNTTIVINPKDIDLTIVRSFPDVSVEFKNIATLDATTAAKRDTLLKAGKISLAFNVMDLFRHKYSIHNISVEDAVLKVWIDEKGRDNYHFLKADNDTIRNDSSHVSFALNKIELKNCVCSYSDKQEKTFYKADFHKLNFTGDFGKEKYDFGAESEFTINNLESGKASYFKGNPGAIDLVMEIDNIAHTYTIKKGKLKIADLGLTVSGNAVQQKQNYLLDLAVKGDDIDLAAALSLLPASVHDDLQGLESKGEFYVDGTVKGLYSDSTSPAINARFGINSGASIGRKDGSVKLSDIALQGLFSNAKGKEGLQISNFSAASAKSKFGGSFSVSGFKHPHYNAKLSGRIDIAELQNVLHVDTIEQASGTLEIQVQGSGNPEQGPTLTPKDFRAFKTSGIAKFTNTLIKLKGARFPVDGINGKLAFDGNNVSVNAFTAKTAGSDILVNGTVKNLLGYLFTPKEVLDISGDLSSKNLNLDSLLSSEGQQQTKNEEAYHLVLPERLRLNLNTSIQHVSFRKFEATAVNGDLQMNKQRLTVDPVRFNAMGGSLSGSGMIDGTREDSLLITCNADIQNLNIYKLFYEMENFGQDKDTTITCNNLRGNITSHINFASLWGNDLSINEKKIYTDADITITDGELINFRPLEVLSRFIKLDDLKDIRFKSLHNNIEIKNRLISIPKMEINSSAINISMSGTHDFDNNVDYHFIVDMDEIRAKKAKAAKPQNNEFGVEEDDGGHRTRLFISMKGYIGDPEIKYDAKGAIQTIKEDLHQEKQNLKSILHDEFGWYKNDPKSKSDKKEDRKSETDGKFILKQDDPPKTKDKKKGDDNLDDTDDY